jgi:hypothetical protein
MIITFINLYLPDDLLPDDDDLELDDDRELEPDDDRELEDELLLTPDEPELDREGLYPLERDDPDEPR